MERELVALLGAGLAAVATGFGIPVAVGAIDRGYVLADMLSREGGPRVGATVNTLVQNTWLAWQAVGQQAGVSREMITHHAGALPAILELNRPAPAIFGAARQHPAGGQLLAVELVERARQSGDLARAALDDGLTYQLLESLFRVVLAEQAALAEMMAAVDICLKTELWRHAPVEDQPPQQQTPELGLSALLGRESAPPPPDRASSAADTVTLPNSHLPMRPEPTVPAWPGTLSPAAEAVVRTAVEAHGARIADPQAATAEGNALLIALMARLGDYAARVREAGPWFHAAARHIADGDFAAADRALDDAQYYFIQRAPQDLGQARQMMHWAAEALASRAELEEARFDLPKAARHYRSALRCFTRGDLAPQLRFLHLHATTLFKQDKLHPEDAVFAEGLRSLVDACALPVGDVDANTWAHANVKLAHLYVELADRSGKPEDYLAVARHAGEALTIFLQANDTALIIDAQLLAANAHWRAGDAAGDTRYLAASARGFHMALELMDRAADPDRWIDFKGKLGQVLLRIASVQGEPRLLAAAIEHLRAAVQFAGTCRVPFATIATETALGRALLAEYAAGGQPLLLDLAATAFRRAIKVANLDKAFARKGALEHELGVTLWAMADRASDANGLLAAKDVFDAGIATFRSIGDHAGAATIQADLDRLREAITGKRSSITAPTVVHYS